MAAVAIMITYFLYAINVSEETARSIFSQGLDDFDSLVEFTKADMKTLWHNDKYSEGKYR